MAGSLKIDLVRATGITRMLQTNGRPTKLAHALQELGRLVKHICCVISMTKIIIAEYSSSLIAAGPSSSSMASAANSANVTAGQEDQLGALGALGIVVNLGVFWKTIYMDATLDGLRAEGYEVRPEEVARLARFWRTDRN